MISESFTAGPPGIIAISGATGLIGRALADRLRSRGHTIRRMLRSATGLQAGDIMWDPARGHLRPQDLAGVTAVIHLAGEPVAQRWTPARKTAIRDSRVESTALLARTIAGLDGPRPTLLSGSAIGFYGDRHDELLDETSAAGTGFLADVCREWEAATAPAAHAGARVVHLRTGVVMDPAGGALAKVLTPFRLGVGGPVGTGRQWMSWIGLEDHLRAVEHIMWTESIVGPVNLVAPSPVTNAEFASTLGRVLARPAVVPVPAFAVQLLFGEMADATILAGQRVMPRTLVAAKFDFAYPSLEQALRHALHP